MSTLKRILLWLACWLFVSRRASAEIEPEHIHRILLVRPDDRMGNLILTTPVAAGLRHLFPQARIDWLVPARFQDLVKQNPYQLTMLPFNKRWLFKRPLRWLLFFLRLRRMHYDLTIDASHSHAQSTTGLLITLWANSPLRIGHARGKFDRAYTHPTPIPEEELHEQQQKMSLLAPFGEQPPLPSWTGAPSENSIRLTERWLAENSLLNRPLLFVWPGGRKADRRFPLTLYQHLLTGLRGQVHWQPVIGWGPQERHLAQALARTTNSFLIPEADPDLLAALLGRMHAYLGNDTGPLHLAAAKGLPTYALAAPQVATRWTYNTPPHRTFVVPSEIPDRVKISRDFFGWLDGLTVDPTFSIKRP